MPKMPSRLGRFRRKADSPPDEEVERTESSSGLSTFLLRRLGKSLAASIDVGDDYLEDDPIGVFLDQQAAGSPEYAQATAYEGGPVDIPGSPPEPTAEGAPGPTPAPAPDPAGPEPETFAALPAEFSLPSTGASDSPQTPAQPGGPAPLPADIAESMAAASAAAQPTGGPQAPSQPAPAAESAAETPTGSQAVPLELNAQDPAAAEAPPAGGARPKKPPKPLGGDEFAANPDFDSPAPEADASQTEEPPMTLAADSAPVSFDLEEVDADPLESLSEEGPDEDGEGGDESSDSLLDLFRSEDVEENPTADLAKGLPQVDVENLVERVKQLAIELMALAQESENPEASDTAVQ